MPTNIQTRIAKVKQTLDAKNLATVGFPVFYKNTPVKSGNARRNTILNNTQIVAQYPYAKRLDTGWSRQSPDGMVKPTITAIRAYIKQTLGI